MKILHILDHSLPLHSGYTFRSQNIFRAQRKMGYDPVILTSPKHEATWKGDWAEKEVIGFIGSFYRYEGLDLLIKAFARIAPDHPGTVLLLVGGGEMENELKTLASKLGFSLLPLPSSERSDHPSSLLQFQRSTGERILFPGRIPHDRVPGVYSMIDILAYPRYPMRLTELVTPLKPLEAMAMGKALVASDVGGHKELIRHNETGLLFQAGEETELAESLKNLLTNPEKRLRLQEKGFSWVREYHTWKKTTSVYDDIYRRILNS